MSASSALELAGPLSGPGPMVSPPFSELVEVLQRQDLYGVLWLYILCFTPHKHMTLSILV